MDFRSLSTQIVVGFIALVLVAALAVGVPGIWLIQEQMERQAWSQVAQASRASKALYAARRKEVADLAVLTVQRPTLRELLTEGGQERLLSYLSTLRTGADLDLVVVCGSDGRPTACVGDMIVCDVCADEITGGFHVLPPGTSPRVWLLAGHAIGREAADLGKVVVGEAMDDTAITEIGDQAGLEHTLLVEGQPVATSFSEGLASLTNVDRLVSRTGNAVGT
jgi:hypothetical protein